MSHLGTRVSALLDGRLDAAVEERLWAHVHRCHPCRDLVEREGWVKTRLAAWSMEGPAGAERDAVPVPDRLKSSLLDPASSSAAPWPGAGGARGRSALVVGGGVAGAVGVTMVGVLALGVAPADAPAGDRRAPVTELGRHADVSWTQPAWMDSEWHLREQARKQASEQAPPPRTERRHDPRATMGR